jgi:hypothetical protein
MWKLWRSLAAGVLAAGALAVVAPSAAAADAVFTVYMDSAGSDTADGLTPATGVKTLKRVMRPRPPLSGWPWPRGSVIGPVSN